MAVHKQQSSVLESSLYSSDEFLIGGFESYQ
jgi:hypothetical protein